MAGSQELAVRRNGHSAKDEQTSPGSTTFPTDIYETGEALMVTIEMLRVAQSNAQLLLENDSSAFRISRNTKAWNRLTPNMLSATIDAGSRSLTKSIRSESPAQLEDGVLNLTLQKARRALASKTGTGKADRAQWSERN